MTRPIGLSYETVSLARSITGAPAVADTLTTDAALSTTVSTTTGGMVRGRGFLTLWLGLECVGGATPTVTVAPRIRDPEAADGSRWKDLSIGGSAQSVTLTDGGAFHEVRVDGRDFFPVITAITGNPTTVRILVLPGSPTPWHRPSST